MRSMLTPFGGLGIISEANPPPKGVGFQRGVCQTIKNESLKILITIFGLLFLLERKPMNLLFNYIGLILSVALLLGFYNADYISYLLIIIYCSALTIIFGFVLMLCPTEPNSIKLTTYVNPQRGSWEPKVSEMGGGFG